MRRSGVCALAAMAMIAPATAEPVVTSDVPAIRATLQGGEILVRLDQGVMGQVKSLQPRTVLILAYDAAGNVLQQEQVSVSRRMTYARLAVPAAMASAHTLSVTVR